MARVACLPGDRSEPSWDFDYHDGPLILRQEAAIDVIHLSAGSVAIDSTNLHARRQFGGLVTLVESLLKHVPSTLHEISLGDNLYAGA